MPMMSHVPRIFVIVCLLFFAAAQTSAAPPAAMAKTPRWQAVDGRWVRPDRTCRVSQFVKLVEKNGQLRLAINLSLDVEPMLVNFRTAVIELEESPFAWKVSTIGRVWNFNRSAATENLQMVAAAEGVKMPGRFVLTKITITPQVSVLQAAGVVDDQAVSVIVVFTQQFTELAVSELGKAKAITMERGASAREILQAAPASARKYLIPALQLVNGGQNPLTPGAGDVYRAFDVPVDGAAQAAVAKLLPRLASPDARERDAASAELASLGRPGVRAAMGLDQESLPLEAAVRVQRTIDAATFDPRSPEQMRGDLTFVIDAARDPDPHVRAAAEALLRKMK